MNSKATIWTSIDKAPAKTAVLDQAAFPVFWVDKLGQIGYANNQLCNLTGYSNESLTKHTLDLLIPSLCTTIWTKEWWKTLIKDKQIPELSTTFHHQNGEVIERNLSITLINVSEFSFAAFYIWPKVNTTPAKNNASPTHFLENLNESVALLDKNGVVHYANPALCNKFNILVSDLIGRSLFEFITPDQLKSQDIWNAFQQDKASETEFECRTIANKTLVLRMNIVPQQINNQGSETQQQLLVSFVDVTEQHRIAEELKQRNASFERLASNIPGFIYKFKMTSEGKFSFPYASIGCQDIFGIDPVDVENDASPILATIHPDDVQLFQNSVLTSANQLSHWNIEARSLTPQNESKWFHAASRPELQKNGDTIWEGLVMDITDRKIAEGELAKAKESAEASAATKAAFLSNMSHEIRTPLNAVIGLTRLALETNLSSIQHEYISKVLSSSEVLLGIVNNVLDFSKIESGKLQVEQVEFSLSSILENVGNILEAHAAEKGLELLLDNYSDNYEYLIGDPLRLQQVLINFCNNAIKFTDQGEVLISVQAIEEKKEWVKIKFIVEDTGIGLTKKQQLKIFESFTQADSSTTRKYGGTGLGLTICKQIVELMGGEIGVESKIDEGSRFFFTSVLTKVARSSDRIIQIAPEVKEKQLLYIDENPKASQLHSQMLNSVGLQVKCVDSGESAVEALKETLQNSSSKHYDLIIVDWDLSGIDGIDTVRQIKDIQEYAETPIIIMMSTYAIDRFKTLIDDNLVNRLISKPLIKNKFISEIQQIFIGDEQTNTPTKSDLPLSKNYQALLSGTRVLLAEDNTINQEIAQTILANKGIEVIVVNNGREAVDWLLEKANETPVDAVLMDLQMPEMDGFEATRLIRSNPDFSNLPVIAMTAHAFASEKEKCLAAGMQAHVSKPIEPDHLFNTLIDFVQTSRKPNMVMTSKTELSRKTKEDKSSILSGLSTVDVNSAKQLLNQDESLLNKLLHQFARDQATNVKKLKQQLIHHQHSQAADLTHLIKGVAGNLHIRGVFDSAVHLEDALNNDSSEDLNDLLRQFENNFNQFTNELDQLTDRRKINVIDPYSQKNDEITDLEHVQEKLNTMILHLKNNNFKAQSCLDELTPFLSKHYKHELRQFSDLIMDLNFSTAADIARNLKIQISESCLE